MEIQLKELKEGKTEFDFGTQNGKVLEIDDRMGIKVKNFRIWGTITKSRLEYFLILNIKAKVLLQCARCLKKFEKNIEEKGEYHVKMGKDKLLTKKEVEIQEDDINTIYIEETILNLIPLSRELILLAIPMKPLCKDDCLGLCPVCGKNRNFENCKCQIQSQTPFSVLKDIFKKGDEKL